MKSSFSGSAVTADDPTFSQFTQIPPVMACWTVLILFTPQTDPDGLSAAIVGPLVVSAVPSLAVILDHDVDG